MSPKIITLAGLTGRLAGLLISHILDESDALIHGVARSPEKLPKSVSTNARVKIFKGDASDVQTIRGALRGASIAVCCYLGDNDLMLEGQRTLIDACIEEGVPRYAAADWTFDFRTLQNGEHPSKDPMKQIAEYLEQKEAEKKIKAIHILNGCFMEVQFWDGLFIDYDKWTLNYWGTGDEKWELTSYADAAAFSAQVILDDDANGWFLIRGDFISTKEQAVQLEAIFGEKPKLNRLGSLDDCIEIAQRRLRENPLDFWSWIMHFYAYFCLTNKYHMPDSKVANELYPSVKLNSYREYATVDSAQRLKELGKFAAFERVIGESEPTWPAGISKALTINDRIKREKPSNF